MDIEDKIALVTGGANGIGFACVTELLRNGAAHVAILDLANSNGEEAASKLNGEFGQGKAIFVICDVTKFQEFEGLIFINSMLEDGFAKIVNEFGGLDIVINNAGIVDEPHWDLMININYNGVVRGTLLGLQHMGKDKGGKGGTIVNISSLAGIVPFLMFPVYTGTKHAVVGLSRSFATTYGNTLKSHCKALTAFDWNIFLCVLQEYQSVCFWPIQQPCHYQKSGVRILTLCPSVTDTQLLRQSPGRALAFIDPELIIEAAQKFPTQTAHSVALSTVHIIRVGENGSVWFVEGGELAYEVEVPDYPIRKIISESPTPN